MEFEVLKRQCRRCGDETERRLCPQCWCYATPVLVGTKGSTRQISLTTATDPEQTSLDNHVS